MCSCVWLHFKKCFRKYFLMFGCVLENTIENTFSTCCLHFLTFSWLPNKYIISFIPQNTNKTQKKIIKSEQTKARSQLARSQSRSQSTRSHDRDRSFTRCVDRDRDRRRLARCRWSRGASAIAISSFSLPLSLSSIFQGRKSFEVKIETKMIFLRFGSEIWSTGNAFQFDRIWSNNQTPYFPENHFRNQFEVNSNTA